MRARRFEEERKELGAAKAKLVKENEVKKARLEDLEKQLTDFVEVRPLVSLSKSALVRGAGSSGSNVVGKNRADTSRPPAERQGHPGQDAGGADRTRRTRTLTRLPHSLLFFALPARLPRIRITLCALL